MTVSDKYYGLLGLVWKEAGALHLYQSKVCLMQNVRTGRCLPPSTLEHEVQAINLNGPQLPAEKIRGIRESYASGQELLALW